MPKAAPKKCVEVGCSALVHGGSRCPLHQKETWKKKPTATKRITGRRLQELREQLFKRNPLCAMCGIRAAQIRDHIIPLFEGGEDVESNTQGLCHACDEEKSKAESIRSRGRAGQNSP